MPSLLAKTLVNNGHIRSFHVRSDAISGWEVLEQMDDRPMERHHCSDWHRVERTLVRFTQTIDELSGEGWRDA